MHCMVLNTPIRYMPQSAVNMIETPGLDVLRDRFKLGRNPAQGEDHVPIIISPQGFTLRPPPKPHCLNTFVTPDDQLFHTMHMGAAIVNQQAYSLIVDGLVAYPLRLSLSDLQSLPSTTITSFHECYGSPLKPPTTPLYRVGNVRWTGVRLSLLLAIAQPIPQASSPTYVWSTGLDHGNFFHIVSDSYQKDLPLQKALDPNTLLAWYMNGEPLTKERGSPVRLVVPGWFGTNSTKWLCRLSVQASRSSGPWTTELYNEIDPTDETRTKMRPVWMAEVNSMIFRPAPGATVKEGLVTVCGWAWGCTEVVNVNVTVTAVRCGHGGDHADETGENNNLQQVNAQVQKRKEFEWQLWEVSLNLVSPVSPRNIVQNDVNDAGGPSRKVKYTITARATDANGAEQPLSGRRNHVHSIEIEVAPKAALST